jgi:hypothetical protein
MHLEVPQIIEELCILNFSLMQQCMNLFTFDFMVTVWRLYQLPFLQHSHTTIFVLIVISSWTSFIYKMKVMVLVAYLFILKL